MELIAHALRSPEFWKHLSIPFVAAFVGWITNVVAIKLTFKPLEFVGIRPLLGWQGIIPSKAAKMAEIFVDKTMFRLGTLQELFQQMEPEIIAAHISKIMDRRLESYTDEIMFYSNPRVWRLLPQAVKNRIYLRVREEMPRLVDNLMQDAAQNVEQLIDFVAIPD